MLRMETDFTLKQLLVENYLKWQNELGEIKTQKEFAEDVLDIHEVTFSRYFNEQRQPSKAVLVQFAEKTGNNGAIKSFRFTKDGVGKLMRTEVSLDALAYPANSLTSLPGSQLIPSANIFSNLGCLAFHPVCLRFVLQEVIMEIGTLNPEPRPIPA